MNTMPPSLSTDPISVMLVDDSAVIRAALARILEGDPSIKVVASKSNGLQAVESVSDILPDIILLDIEMPIMDGITALPRLLEQSPASNIVIVSALSEKGATISLKAMSLGAVDCFVKPQAGGAKPGSDFQRDLIARIKSLAPTHKQANAFKTSPNGAAGGETMRTNIPAPIIQSEAALYDQSKIYQGKPSIIAIGSSTGGPQALASVVPYLKNVTVPVVITQHMPPTFTKILAEHITTQSGIPAHEAEDGMTLENGKIYVAPGDYHMTVERDGTQLVAKLNQGPQINFCRPAVDPMLDSVVDIYGQKVLCIILTGMGHDGLESGKRLVEKGGKLIAQDEETSVVWGMPGAVAKAGICSEILPIDKIGPAINRIIT